MMVMYGSTIFIIALTEGRVNDPRLWYAPWLFPGQHASMAGLSTSGTLTHWFRDQFARELPRETAFGTLAPRPPPRRPAPTGLLVLPYFTGERTPIHDARAKGTFFGLNLTHTRGDMFRALAGRHRQRHRPCDRDLSRNWPARQPHPRRRRRREEPGLAAGDLGHREGAADRQREIHRRELRRRLPGGAGHRHVQGPETSPGGIRRGPRIEPHAACGLRPPIRVCSNGSTPRPETSLTLLGERHETADRRRTGRSWRCP